MMSKKKLGKKHMIFPLEVIMYVGVNMILLYILQQKSKAFGKF